MLSTVPPKSHLPQPLSLRLQTQALWLGRSPPDPTDDKLTEPCLWSRKTTLDRCYHGQLEAARRSKACGQPGVSLGCHQRPHSLHKAAWCHLTLSPSSLSFAHTPNTSPTHPWVSSLPRVWSWGQHCGEHSEDPGLGQVWARVLGTREEPSPSGPETPAAPPALSYQSPLCRGCSHLNPPTPRPPCRVSPKGCAQSQASAAGSEQGAAREPVVPRRAHSSVVEHTEGNPGGPSTGRQLSTPQAPGLPPIQAKRPWLVPACF